MRVWELMGVTGECKVGVGEWIWRVDMESGYGL